MNERERARWLLEARHAEYNRRVLAIIRHVYPPSRLVVAAALTRELSDPLESRYVERIRALSEEIRAEGGDRAAWIRALISALEGELVLAAVAGP